MPRLLRSLVALCLLTTTLCRTSAAADPKAGATTAGGTPTPVTFADAAKCPPFEYDDGKKHRISSMDELLVEFNGGVDWTQFQNHLKGLLENCDDKASITELEFQNKPFVVIFLVREQSHFVVIPEAQPYSPTLLGADLINVVVLGDLDAQGVSKPSTFLFESTRVDNPLLGQIAQAVQQIAGGIIPKGKAANKVVTLPPSMYAYVARDLKLPFKRASIKATASVSVKCSESGVQGVLPKCAAGKPKTLDVNIDMTLANTPATRAEFTAVAAAVVGPFYGQPKVKVDNGKYASDPLSKGMTMVALAMHFVPYNSTLADMSKAERFAYLVGGVVTPAPGLGIGLSIGIVRGFSINVGEIVVWVPTSSNGAGPGGNAPTDQNQLRTRGNWGTFVGGNYVFGKSGS